ncbi:MAG: GTPase Era [Thermoanaerobaculia bacterium]|nr:GTPase Era [Thermoanaerobaculia bacterium]
MAGGSDPSRRSGIVALAGRPNAGKSTLMNRLLAEKVAIVSDKPQTTRHVLIGILTEERGQIVFHDTPGMHKPLHRLNRQMVRSAREALGGADVACLVVDASTSFGAGERYMLDLFSGIDRPKVLVLNKIDRMDKRRLLPIIERYSEAVAFDEIIPASALTGDGTERVVESLFRLLPEGEPLYDPELLTLHPERFLAAERIREKVLEHTEDELPFTTAVIIDRWEEDDDSDLVRIFATILVERVGQKKIVIGRGGSNVKAIGTAARLDLEEFLGRRVYLELWVRIEPEWREQRRVLAELDKEHLGAPPA